MTLRLTCGALETEEPATSRNVVSCARPAGQKNDFELIPTVHMESQHSVGMPTCRDFLRFVFISQISGPEVGTCWRCSRTFWPFGKKTPYGQIFKNVFWKDSSRHRSTSCVRISWNLANQKSVKSRLAHQTKKPAPDNILGLPQISSKSVLVSDIAIFVLKRDVKLQLTN